jgi:hypothetical protein
MIPILRSARAPRERAGREGRAGASQPAYRAGICAAPRENGAARVTGPADRHATGVARHARRVALLEPRRQEARPQQPQPSHAHGSAQPHAGEQRHPPFALAAFALQAQAAESHLVQRQAAFFFSVVIVVLLQGAVFVAHLR